MKYASINIQGNIISSEVLDKIRTDEKFKHQNPESFGLARSASLRDEIGLAWSILRTHWHAYKKRLESLPKGDSGTSLTREKWILPLLTELGYELGIQRAQLVNGKSYAISHAATNRGHFPVHIMGFHDNLDKRRDTGGPRLSPHALAQEYLNNTEHLFALVTNGRHLRLLRDATRLVRMSYLEFNLERMFEEELYADFSLLYRVLHVSRMPEKIDAGSDSVIEYYHQESLASGTRIREKLSEAVESSIKTLANGFLTHPKNQELTQKFEADRLDPADYYMYQLRLIYRVLFVIVLEERQLIYPDELDADGQRKRSIYYKYYSIERLRRLTETRVYIDGDKVDLWESLKSCFLLFESGQYGEKLGIKPLGSGLFAPNALGGLMDYQLKNADLLEVLKRLTTFVNEQGQLVRVNYSDLDVEEFGSVYEGLLEYDPNIERIGAKWQFSFVEGKGRSSSGSHYTPEELVKPLIKHSLDYIIADKLKEANPEQALLSITVCDVACGSGHILLSAARRIATELASLREGAEQASPIFYRAAIRDVIRNCIYGVDLNPLAVELCKVALWLEAHNPNEPLNFLDHRIKNGNAIVGLAHRSELENGIADEAFKTLPDDDKDIAKAWRDRNVKERKERATKALQLKAEFEKSTESSVQEAIAEFNTFKLLPEATPEEIERKAKAYKRFIDGKGFTFLKAMADTQVAQFFIPKTEDNKVNLMSDADYRLILSGYKGWQDRKVAKATAIAYEQRFFHWFIEFPEVFSDGGFDCILGNPPYLGGTKISTNYGNSFLNYLYFNYVNASNRCDLVAYFVRRDYQIIRKTGFLALITTDAITSGDTLKGSLISINNDGGGFSFAVKSIPWPGKAATNVSLFAIGKFIRVPKIILNGKHVDGITPKLEEGMTFSMPFTLQQSGELIFSLGIKTYNDGFIITKDQSLDFTSSNQKNSEVIHKWIDGDYLNSSFEIDPEVFLINLNELELEEAENRYKTIMDYLRATVKIERDGLGDEKEWDKKFKKYWWHHADKRVAFFNNLKSHKDYFVIQRAAKYLNFTKVKSDIQFSDNIIGLITNWCQVAALQSSFHSEWAWNYSKKTGGSTIRYSTNSCLETFPLPEIENKEFVSRLESIGEAYHEHRRQLMLGMQLGLTKTYNLFHSNAIASQAVNEQDKQVAGLHKQLEKTPDTFSFNEAIQGILKLRELHVQMDQAVLETYGWNDIVLRHDFYEVDYLPENDRIRFTIHPEARKEILKRLLLLNHERFEAEVAQGLHKKKDVEAYYAQKRKPIPPNTVFSDSKSKSNKVKPKKSKTSKSQIGMFGEGSE